ncbi:MAG: hypothetical protein RLZZ450_6860 [Pseudomonadota bacterium]
MRRAPDCGSSQRSSWRVDRLYYSSKSVHSMSASQRSLADPIRAPLRSTASRPTTGPRCGGARGAGRTGHAALLLSGCTHRSGSCVSALGLCARTPCVPARAPARPYPSRRGPTQRRRRQPGQWGCRLERAPRRRSRRRSRQGHPDDTSRAVVPTRLPKWSRVGLLLRALVHAHVVCLQTDGELGVVHSVAPGPAAADR